MSVSKTNTKYAVKVEYKPDYDTNGEFPTLAAYSQTFSNVKETATVDQLKAYADALMCLTVYKDAPYKVYIIDTGTLVNA